jgi:hypothetical protein
MKKQARCKYFMGYSISGNKERISDFLIELLFMFLGFNRPYDTISHLNFPDAGYSTEFDSGLLSISLWYLHRVKSGFLSHMKVNLPELE